MYLADHQIKSLIIKKANTVKINILENEDNFLAKLGMSYMKCQQRHLLKKQNNQNKLELGQGFKITINI